MRIAYLTGRIAVSCSFLVCGRCRVRRSPASWGALGLVFGSAAAFGCAAAHVERAPLSAAPASPASSATATSPLPTLGAQERHTAWPFGAPAPDQDTESLLARLAKDAGPIKSNWIPPHRTERYGHAEGLITAPYHAVRARLTDFAHYQALAGPKFAKVHVVGKGPGATDVYFNLPIMHGLVRLWYVTRFGAPRPAQTEPQAHQGAGDDGRSGGGDRQGEVVEGTFVKGNLRTMHIVFTLHRALDEGETAVACDLLLSLTIPAPQANVDEELRDACGDAILALRRSTAPPVSAIASP
jgi:hypothetical protein